MIHPTSSVGYGVKRTCRRTYSVGRSDRARMRSSWRPKASTAASICRSHDGTQIAPCSMTPMRRRREALEHAVEDHGGERLRRRPGDAHVVDGPEVLLAAVEVGRHGQPVVEVVPVDEVARSPDVEDHADAGFLGAVPTPGPGRCGWASARVGIPTPPAARPLPCRWLRPPWRGPGRSRRAVRSRSGGAGRRRSRTPPCRGCGPVPRRRRGRGRRRAPSRADAGCGRC